MIWILTEEYNDYDQHGEYFVDCFKNKPTKEQLQTYTNENDTGLNHLLNGGGRIRYEGHWYNLKQCTLK